MSIFISNRFYELNIAALNHKMIFEQQYRLVIKKQLQTQEIKLFRTFSETFLIILQQQNIQGSIFFRRVLHVDKKGSLLHEYRIPYYSKFNAIAQPFMISNKQLAFTNENENKIEIIDISNGVRRYIFHHFELSFYMQICYFWKTDLICLIQKFKSDKQHLQTQVKITYYKASQGIKIQQYILSLTNQFKYSRIIKANSHSMLVWVNDKKSFYISTIGKIKKIGKNNLKLYPYPDGAFQFKSNHIWIRIYSRSYYISLQDQSIQQSLKSQEHLKHASFLHKFSLLGKHKSCEVDQRILIKTFKTQHNWNQQESYIPFMLRQNLNFIEYVDELIFSHRTQNKKEINVKVYSAYPLKQIFIVFMLHINEDFDDDLLYDAIERLEVQ